MTIPGIFISWSGEVSHGIADCLRQTLPLIYRVQPWLSTRDLPLGRPWLSELLGQLQQCDIGILVVTPENIESSWMQFEAGALCKNFGHSRVFPFLVGLDHGSLRGPFSQFQAVLADEAGTQYLIERAVRSVRSRRTTRDDTRAFQCLLASNRQAAK